MMMVDGSFKISDCRLGLRSLQSRIGELER